MTEKGQTFSVVEGIKAPQPFEETLRALKSYLALEDFLLIMHPMNRCKSEKFVWSNSVMKPFQVLFAHWWNWMQSHKQILRVGKKPKTSQWFSQKLWCYYWVYVFSHTRRRGQPQKQLLVINCSTTDESTVVLVRRVLRPWVSSGTPLCIPHPSPINFQHHLPLHFFSLFRDEWFP